jgi:hypothetical protein
MTGDAVGTGGTGYATAVLCVIMGDDDEEAAKEEGDARYIELL